MQGMMVLEKDQSMTWLTILEQVGCCHCVFTLYPVCHVSKLARDATLVGATCTFALVPGSI